MFLSGLAWAEAAEDIRDIRGPKAVPPSWWLMVIVAVALVASLSTWLWWWRSRRPTRPRLSTPWQEALEGLEAAKPLMRPATAREFAVAASEVVRRYIENRFEIVATQRTTEEFLQVLVQGSNEALARHRARLARFLEACDVVKFAGASMAMAEMESLFQNARAFVLETGEPSRP